MPKICKSCGREYTEEYCEHCGYGNPDIKIKATKKYQTKIPERFLPPEEQERLAKERLTEGKRPKTKTDKQKRNQKILLIVLIALIAGIIFYVLNSQGILFSNNPEELVNQYFTSISEMDYDKYNDCFTDDLADANNKAIKAQDLDKDKAMETLYSDYINVFGNDFKSDIKIEETSDMDKGDIIEEEMNYQTQFKKTISIEEGKNIKTTVKFEGSKSTDEIEFNVYVGKLGGKWYILNVKETEEITQSTSVSSSSSANTSEKTQ